MKTRFYLKPMSLLKGMLVAISVLATQSAFATRMLLDSSNFPDRYFRAYISQLTGVEEGDLLESDNVTEINISPATFADATKIKSLDGIKNFLHCSKFIFNDLPIDRINIGEMYPSEVSVKGCTELTFLSVQLGEYPDEMGGGLTSLDLSTNSKLKELNISYNPIKTIDLSNLTQLEVLRCIYTQLENINFSASPNLQKLYCYNSKLTNLDLSKTPNLAIIYCNENQLTSLDVSNQKNLGVLHCWGNKISSIDLSNCPYLNDLNIDYNPLGKLDVSNNKNLSKLWCDSCDLEKLDISMLTNLYSLRCMDNNIQELDFSHSPGLFEVYASNNPLGSVDFSKNKKIEGFGFNFCNLNELDVTMLPDLKVINCNGNHLQSIDLSKNPLLTGIMCRRNELTSLDLSASRIATMVYAQNQFRDAQGKEIYGLGKDFDPEMAENILGGFLTTLPNGEPAIQFDEDVTEITYDYNPQAIGAGSYRMNVTIKRGEATGIGHVNQTKEVVNTRYYSLSGANLHVKTYNEPVIEEKYYSDGTVTRTKKFIKK